MTVMRSTIVSLTCCSINYCVGSQTFCVHLIMSGMTYNKQGARICGAMTCPDPGFL